MKIYNPFKPHIVEFENGKFAVRKIGFPFGFGFAVYKGVKLAGGKDRYFWWYDNTAEYAHRYQLESIEQAKVLLCLS